MDARQVRTRSTLARTIRELASERSLDDISVTDVATRAGISRPTFYAHADSPGALLGSVLADELAAETPARSGSPTAQLTQFLTGVAEHVQRNRELYRNNVRLRLPPRLRDVLLEHLERGFTAHLGEHPDIAPHIDESFSPVTAETGGPATAETGGPVDVPRASSRDHQVFAAIAASGTVAALENWLRSPDAVDPDRVVEIVLTGIAEWWSA
jgi:AcrR family transcriptional regulator